MDTFESIRELSNSLAQALRPKAEKMKLALKNLKGRKRSD